MKRKRWLRLAMACWMAVSAFAVSAEEFMPVKDIQPGMKGIAKTVVTGRTIEPFDVEVLGIMKDKGPSGDLILARFSGDVMDRTGGIAHGMSGSPVYIDGKLVGAVAYGWSFADGKIGMITPIEDMVKLWSVPDKEEISQKEKNLDGLIPIASPLMAAGMDQTSLEWFSSKLPQYAFTPIDTASVSSDEEAYPLEAGGSVAASFITGDVKMGAIGTVTYVDNDRIVAFGHPFMKKGPMDYFMNNAYIFTIVKSVSSAFKLGSVGAEIGSIQQDRGAGIAGTVGRIQAGIPMRIHVSDEDTGAANDYTVRIIEDKELTPVLAATSVYNFLNKTLDRTGGGTADIEYTITEKGGENRTFTRHTMYYSGKNINEKSVDELYNVVNILMNNEFKEYSPTDMKVTVSVTGDKKVARIVEATASPIVVSPGDVIDLEVQIHPYRGEMKTERLSYTVPKNQPIGPATLEIRGGGVVPLPYLIEKQKYNLTDEILQRLRTYEDFADLKKKLETEDTNQELVAEILQTGVSMVDDGEEPVSKTKIEGKETNKLPESVVQPKAEDAMPDEDTAKAKIKTPYIIVGDGQIMIQIVKPEDKEKTLRKRNQNNKEKAVMQPEDTKESAEPKKENNTERK